MKTLKNLPKDWQETVMAMGGEGKLPTEIVKSLGISWTLHRRFREQEEEYRDVFERSRLAAEAWWDQMGRENVDKPAKEFNATLYIWIMKSVFKRRDIDPVVRAGQEGMADEDQKRAIRDKYKPVEEGESLN